MSATTVGTTDSLQALPPTALALLTPASACGIYGSAAWYQNLAAHVDFGAGARVVFHTAVRDGQTRVVLPLLTHPAERRASHLANYYTPLAAPAASDASAQDWQVLFSALRQQRPALAELRLGPLPGDAALAPQLTAALQAAGFHVAPYFCFGNWYLPRPDSWGQYWAGRAAILRNTVARKGRRFAGVGGRIDILQAPADVERGIAAFDSVYAESWKGPEPHPGFMPGLLRLAAQQGWLRLGVAWIGPEPVAAQVWLVAGGKADIYKLAYRERFREHAAGTLLTAAMMQHAFEQDGVDEVDYLMGDDAYKQSWMTQRRERWGLVAHDPGTWRGAAALVRQRLARVRQAVRR